MAPIDLLIIGLSGIALAGLFYLVTQEVLKGSTLRREVLLSIRYTVERVGAMIIGLWIARRILGL